MDVHHPSFTRSSISTARPHAQPLNSKLINCLMGLTIGALVAPTYLLSAANPAMAQFTPSTQSEQSDQAPAFAATTIPDSIADATAAPTSVQSLLSTEFPPAEEVLQLASAPSQLAVRSIWLDRETIVNAGSPQGLARVFDRFKSAGINTVFVETVNAGYPIYPSDVAPEQNPNIQGWDPLQAAVDLGKANGIEVHAWVWLFAAGNQAHNRLLGQPSHYPGPILSARPDWAGFDNHGNLIIPGQNKPFLDPANPEVRQYLLDMLGEIATQ